MICSHCRKKIFSNHRKQLSHGENMQITYQTEKGEGEYKFSIQYLKVRQKEITTAKTIKHTQRSSGRATECSQRILQAKEGHHLRTKAALQSWCPTTNKVETHRNMVDSEDQHPHCLKLGWPPPSLQMQRTVGHRFFFWQTLLTDNKKCKMQRTSVYMDSLMTV